MPENMPDEILDRMSEYSIYFINILDRLPDRISNYMSDRMPDRMSDMLENMPD